MSEKTRTFLDRCLPSVRGQSEGGFAWIVRIDDDCDMAAEAKAAMRRLDCAHAIAVPRGANSLSGEVTEVQRGQTGVDWLLTLRLDCDDALNRVYVETLLDCAAAWLADTPAPEAQFFSFPFGVQYDGETLFPFTGAYNNACAYLEPASAALATVYRISHGRIHEAGGVEMIHTRQPMWLQSTGVANISNDPRRGMLRAATGKRERRCSVSGTSVRAAGGAARPFRSGAPLARRLGRPWWSSSRVRRRDRLGWCGGSR